MLCCFRSKTLYSLLLLTFKEKMFQRDNRVACEMQRAFACHHHDHEHFVWCVCVCVFVDLPLSSYIPPPDCRENNTDAFFFVYHDRYTLQVQEQSFAYKMDALPSSGQNTTAVQNTNSNNNFVHTHVIIISIVAVVAGLVVICVVWIFSRRRKNLKNKCCTALTYDDDDAVNARMHHDHDLERQTDGLRQRLSHLEEMWRREDAAMQQTTHEG